MANSEKDFSNKILTSARNGEIMTWDLNRNINAKFGTRWSFLNSLSFSSPPEERRARDHTRAIHRLSYSPIVHHYCLSGSADGDVRIWVTHYFNKHCGHSKRIQDLRDMSKSVLKIHHPTGVRALAFSSSQSQPLHTIVGLDNGTFVLYSVNIY